LSPNIGVVIVRYVLGAKESTRLDIRNAIGLRVSEKWLGRCATRSKRGLVKLEPTFVR
jgi:hypothetical protein